MIPSFLTRFPRTVVALHATGRYGAAQLRAMRDAGTTLTAVIAPGRGGGAQDGIPLLDDLRDLDHMPEAAILYTPPDGVLDAVRAAAYRGIKLIIAAAEYVPVHDSLKAAHAAREAGAWLLGPNTLGLCLPGEGLLGAVSPEFCAPGDITLLCRSGTLTLLLSRLISESGLGLRAAIHLGGDPVIGRNPHEYLDGLAADSRTRAVLYAGELGGEREYALAEALPRLGKPLVALVVGRHAPPGRRMGHAGALAGAQRETAEAKLAALAAAGAIAARSPAEAVAALRSLTPP